MLEIETYRSHSLHKEARIRCIQLAGFIRNNGAITNKQTLLAQLSSKVKKIEAAAKAFSEFSDLVEMSPEQQKVVRQFFTTGKGGRASADFETATALLIFGQRSAAMKAFQALINEDTHRNAAAKSIIRCYLGDGHIQGAVSQYLEWYKGGILPFRTLASVRIFLQAVLIKKGYQQQLPVPSAPEAALPEQTPAEVLGDFLSIVIPYTDQRFNNEEAVMEVNFQQRKMINCIVPKSEEVFLERIKSGDVFPDVQINGTEMITFCSIRMIEINKIRVGKHAGDTTITLEVLDDQCAV